MALAPKKTHLLEGPKTHLLEGLWVAQEIGELLLEALRVLLPRALAPLTQSERERREQNQQAHRLHNLRGFTV